MKYLQPSIPAVKMKDLTPKMNVSMPKFIPEQINKKIRPFIWKAHSIFFHTRGESLQG